MTSQKQIEANKANSVLGGVKTEAGKSISKYNALTHGLLRQSITLYEEDIYTQFYNDLEQAVNPVGFIEELLTERIATCYVKLFRIQKAETEMLNSRLSPTIYDQTDTIRDWLEPQKKIIQQGYTPKLTEVDIRPLVDTYSRYEVAVENRLYKALHELERLQSVRGLRLVVDSKDEMGSFRKTV